MGHLVWKRIYDDLDVHEGYRILIDRLWPRGINKERAGLDYWAKEIAPTADLRKAYHTETIDYDTFSAKYAAEIEANPTFGDFVALIRTKLTTQDVIMLYGMKEADKSQLPILRKYVEKVLEK